MDYMLKDLSPTLYIPVKSPTLTEMFIKEILFTTDSDTEKEN